MIQPTKTINRIHFSDLDPLRFEDLCLNIISRDDNYTELKHFGRTGNDDGVDISAIINDKKELLNIQCKRYKKITTKELKNIVDKISTQPTLPFKILLIISCDVSKSMYQIFENYSKEKGIEKAEIWTASILEAKLYKEYKDLLFIYFGIHLEKKSIDNVSKIKQSVKMEKRILKELFDHKSIKEKSNSHFYVYRPWERFITEKVCIRSIDDVNYPSYLDIDGEISSWFEVDIYDTYHNGIELCLDSISSYVIEDKDGFWEPIYSDDKRRNNPKYKTYKSKKIGRIPYYNIVEIKKDGDEHIYEPHLFCKFNINGMPYEDIYYKYYGNPEERIVDWDFDKEKQTKFPEE